MTHKWSQIKFKRDRTGTEPPTKSPTRFRQYVLNVEQQSDEYLKKLLAEVIEHGLLPKRTTVLTFLEATLIPNAVRLVEADMTQRRKKESLIVTPGEAAKQGLTYQRGGKV